LRSRGTVLAARMRFVESSIATASSLDRPSRYRALTYRVGSASWIRRGPRRPCISPADRPGDRAWLERKHQRLEPVPLQEQRWRTVQVPRFPWYFARLLAAGLAARCCFEPPPVVESPWTLVRGGRHLDITFHITVSA
jgi:hypothetical protein